MLVGSVPVVAVADVLADRLLALGLDAVALQVAVDVAALVVAHDRLHVAFLSLPAPARTPTRPPIAYCRGAAGWGCGLERFHDSGICTSVPRGGIPIADAIDI